MSTSDGLPRSYFGDVAGDGFPRAGGWACEQAFCTASHDSRMEPLDVAENLEGGVTVTSVEIQLPHQESVVGASDHVRIPNSNSHNDVVWYCLVFVCIWVAKHFYGPVSNRSRVKKSRAKKSRVKNPLGNFRILFHQTSEEFAQKILNSQRMLRGIKGLAGGGIYFAVSAHDTNHKAQKLGCVLECVVYLEREKSVAAIPSREDRQMTHRKLKKQGYDSVKILRPGGTEYVVYDCRQVTKIQKHRALYKRI